MRRAQTSDFANLPAVVAAGARDHPVVAFDVFDTLLCRQVAPDDVKETCARELAARLGIAGASNNLYEARRELEAALCTEAVSAGNDAEFRHGELMRRWVHRFAPEHPTLGAELEAYELACERLVTAPTSSALAAVAAARAAGARVIWVSDNYLPAAAIDGLLAAHGLRSWLHAGYVSATHLHTKRSGRLYLDVALAEGIAPQQILVVGDDRHADRDVPVRLGARAVWVRDTAALARRRRLQVAHDLLRRHAYFAGHRLATSASFRADRRVQQRPSSPHRELGGLLGATFCAFALFVHERARDLGLRRVFFLSREGATFLRLYRQVGRALGEAAPPATYFCASRRSTFLPSLRRLDVGELDARLWRWYPGQSLHQLLTDLSLPASLTTLARAHGLSDPHAALSAADTRLAAFLADARVQNAFANARDEARQRLLAYWTGKGGSNDGPFGIVDVGWKGTIQNNLVRAIAASETPEMEGFYLALAGGNDDGRDNGGDNSRKRGYLFDDRRDGAHAQALLQNSQVFEMFATAPHGAVTGYIRRRERVRPLLAPEARVDARLWREVRQGLHEGAADCLAAMTWLRPSAEDLRPWLLDRIHRYVHYPTMAEARAILRYRHGESFGGRASTRYEFAGSWRQILFGGAPWGVAARAAAAFARQEWPGAALRRSRVPGLCYLYDRYRWLQRS